MLVNDQQASNSHPYGRGLVVTVAGDSPHELEQAALRQATEFFGPGAELDVNTTYTAHPARDSADNQGKAYRTRITVREVARAGRP